ncbi:MAG: NAD(P)(+) transhydrogenase (Re/Si-specific) subunit beta, partial [Planctomycetaceae bacterium]|nr:NAD(P)(+) transhydrogenase (Re/Si-specific) subunit beta [Planctomycetaceae bacterium]
MTIPHTVIEFLYLVAATLFILGLKGMTRPKTAVRGNLLGACGMLVAVVATLFNVIGFAWILAGMILGGAVGAYIALTIKMEKMPEMVGLLNGLGGAASFLVAGAEFYRQCTPIEVPEEGWTSYPLVTALKDTNLTTYVPAEFLSVDALIATALSGIIGAVTLSGSFVAFAKLAELSFVKKMKPLPQQQIINAALAIVILLVTIWMVNSPGQFQYWLIVILGLALGYLLTISIGGADMPVVIALLNSYSGLAAAATGFVLSNNVLIISGSLVGASGLILTKIMCDAMNRSLPAVLFGSLGPTADGPSADEVYATVKSTSADEVAMMLDIARRVVIVPGYGMAVAQAQHAV